MDKNIRNEQAGFREGRSCTDHIFVLRQLLEQSTEWNNNLYALHVDFEKAFDSLHRETLWKILRSYGLLEKIVNIISMLYQDCQCRVVYGQHLTDSFRVQTGVKQGCILTPFIFLVAMNCLLKRTAGDRKKGTQ